MFKSPILLQFWSKILDTLSKHQQIENFKFKCFPNCMYKPPSSYNVSLDLPIQWWPHPVQRPLSCESIRHNTVWEETGERGNAVVFVHEVVQSSVYIRVIKWISWQSKQEIKVYYYIFIELCKSCCCFLCCQAALQNSKFLKQKLHTHNK
jgi:hypothetical protein